MAQGNWRPLIFHAVKRKVWSLGGCVAGHGPAKESAGWPCRASVLFPASPGEICGFRIHGSGVPFEAVILDKATGEGLIRAKEPVDCEAQKEHTFTIQAYDCGEGPDGTNTKKSHK